MKYYIISGEASGDLHGSNLVKEIKKLDAEADFRGWGGELLSDQGVDVVKHYRDLAFMGFYEVLVNIKTILKNFKFCKSDIMEYNPDAVILVDYPGFNLRMAEFAHKKGFKVFYYIAPQAWAWKKSRVHKIKKCVDKLFTLLPFEESFFRKYGIDAKYVGHPILDHLKISYSDKEKEKFFTDNNLEQHPVIALLPGSRKQEINTMLPIMLQMLPMYKDYQFVIGGAPAQELEIYQKHIKQANVKVLFNQGQQLMKYADAALITSGTATLEAALLRLPQVICYKGNKISIAIAKKIVNIKYIGLANLIMDRPVIKELIQDDMTLENMHRELDLLLYDKQRREKLFKDYKELKYLLGGKGASVVTAEGIVGFLKS
ncbi:MAG: lipid-A-disaccharide synthase [Bacteroidota bacterium]|nr:lipid-A-disaccharide synthase [Bacteroidota bacterium]